ncbi:MAG: NTP transferase domain-containing protein [Myxococcales bacterium]|nr:NTP transferase domain-containing protein [Myxococcales bacterium]
MIQVLILAGGSGTRFWPLSRRRRAKQFLAIVGREPLLRLTAQRVLPLCGWQGLWVVTGADQADQVRRILPELPRQHILAEPRARNTAAAIALGAAAAGKRDPEGVLAVLPSDHVIRPVGRFRSLLRAAANAARDGGIITFGVQPTRAETGYGYIQAGAPLQSTSAGPVLRVRRFTEKPDRARAERFLRQGGYYWNSGMFVFGLATLRRELARHLPPLALFLDRLVRLPRRRWAKEIGRTYSRLPSVSIDYGVMEKSSAVRMLSCDCAWSDVGSFSALTELGPTDGAGNWQRGQVLALDCRGCVLRSERRLLACVGLEDIVAVETPDAVLVCSRARAQEVGRLVRELARTGRRRLL